VALGVACALSGGATSPLLPVLLAPVAIALAAFGNGPGARVVVGLAAAALGVLVLAALDVVALPFPPIPAPTAERMTLVGATVSIVLVTIGVSKLADAHRRAGLALERTRAGVLDDALDRAKLAESTGLRIAHEIRNPLTSIKALVSLVARAEIDARHVVRLDVALEEIARIEALVTDYLSLVRPLEALVPKPCDARAIARDVAAVLEGTAAESGATIRVDGGPAPLVADARRLREALLNLGSNALHAMREAETRALTLTVSPHGGGARIVVADTGPGLGADAVARLGEPLRAGRVGGTGLGILLARGVAAQHGGSLTFESAPGRGTRAVLDLPAAPPSDATEENELGERPDRR
jgi:signal transduction histidine kinase